MISAVHEAALGLLQEGLANGEYSVRSLAEAAGVSQPHAQNIMNGRRHASAEVLSALVAAAGITRDAVWNAAGVAPYQPGWRWHGLRKGRTHRPAGWLLWVRPSKRN
jgi:transcriptional regulator with XRE-family HTH domain